MKSHELTTQVRQLIPGSRMIERFLALETNKKLLVGEAVFFLLIASVAIWVLPFRQAFRFGARRLRRKSWTDIAHAVWAVEAAAARVPWRTVCFQKGLALQMILRRRGIDACLHYGVGFAPSHALRAHVWVSAAGEIVIGGREAPNFQLLASMPPPKPS